MSLITPRALLATRGTKEEPNAERGDFKNPKDENTVFKWMYEYGQYLGELSNQPSSNTEARIFEGGHEFPVEEREYAYQWLEKMLLK